MPASDKQILRDLAHRYLEICSDSEQDVLRDLWRRHNSLHSSRPLIHVRAFAWKEMPQAHGRCEDPLFRQYEDFFRRNLFRQTFNDDTLFEPWVTVKATHACSGWGLAGERQYSDEPGGSFKMDYPIKDHRDIERLRMPWHEIDETATREQIERLTDLIGDILPVAVDRGPAYRMWTGDISTDLGYLRGIEHFMLDMLDNPDWLHRLVKILADGILKTHEEAEQAGDWRLCAHENQTMPYAEELDDPSPDPVAVSRKHLWGYMAAQELTAVSPAMHEEFVLNYQIPILKHFGLVAYGCCEDLTRKIDILRKIPNLRRIAVSPFANVARCAEQIGRDYVFSYRPSPADMVSYRFDANRVRSILTRDLRACRECHVDITLKDVETVERDPDRIRKWVAITREVIETL